MIRKTMLLLALGALAAALTLPASAAAPTTPGATLKLEIALLKAGKWQQLYQLYTAKFRQMCPYAKWVAQGKAVQDDFKPVTLKITKTAITGKRALLDYQFLISGKVVNKTKGDLFVKVGSGWYDEVDKVTSC